MKYLNTRGFALAETLIVSVFVMSIFSLMYVNFFPMVGEYEKREKYDDIDSVYNTYLIKRLFEDNTINKGRFQSFRTEVSSRKYSDLSNKCSSLFYDSSKADYCSKLFSKINVDKVYLTTYNITNFKKNLSSLDGYTSDYIKTLPNYTKSSNYNYRVIVKYKHEINDESTKEKKEVYSFATMGVDF